MATIEGLFSHRMYESVRIWQRRRCRCSTVHLARNLTSGKHLISTGHGLDGDLHFSAICTEAALPKLATLAAPRRLVLRQRRFPELLERSASGCPGLGRWVKHGDVAHSCEKEDERRKDG